MVYREVFSCKLAVDEAYGEETNIEYESRYLGEERWLVEPFWPLANMSYGDWDVDSETGKVTPFDAFARNVVELEGRCGLPSGVTPVAAVPTPTPQPVMRPVPTPAPLPSATNVERVSIALPPPLTETNRIWSAGWSILVQHDPYGETLLDNDPITAEAIPQLAKSWSVSNGFRDWRFELERGVPWQHGWGEFTAADVVHTHELLVRDDSNSNFKALWQSASTQTLGDYTVVFQFNPPMVDGERLFSRLAGDMVIQSKSQWDVELPPGYDRLPAGTGSYSYGGRDFGSSIWYERVNSHWNGETPEFPELEWVWAAEQFTRLSLLLAGEVHGSDLARDVWQDAFDRVMKVVSSNNANNQTFGFFGGSWLSTGNEHFQGALPWHDVRVREAMNRAIDRDAILDSVYLGRATPVIVPVFAPWTEGWSARWQREFDDNYGYDPNRARQLLREAGYQAGEIQLDLASIVIPGNEEIPLLAETLATMWEDVGIDTSIQDMELGTWLNKWIGHETHNQFSITRNTPIRTTQEGLRIFFASDPDGFFHGFEHNVTNEKFACLLLRRPTEPD